MAAAVETWTDDWVAIWTFIVWAWQGLEFTGPIFLGGIGAIFGTIYAVLWNNDNLEFVRTLCRRDPLATAWYRVVDWGLRVFERFYGPAWSGEAFGRSFQIALLYPTLALFFGFALGGPLVFGPPELDQVFPRLAFTQSAAPFVYTAAMTAAFGFIFRTNPSDIGILNRWIEAMQRRLGAGGKASWPSAIVRFAFIAALVIVAVVGGMAVVGVLFGGVGMMGAIGVVVASLAFRGTGSLVMAITAVAAFTVIVGFMVVVGGPFRAVGAVYFSLVILAPLLNASLDTVSWYWTRRYLRDLFPETGPRRIGVLRAIDHLARDFALAVLFLVILAIALAGVFALWSEVLRLSGVLNGFPWRDYLKAAQEGPFGEGVGITLMLITTLIPTFLHFFATIMALALPSIGWLWGEKTSTDDLRAPLSRWWLTVITLGSVTLSFAMLVLAAVTTHAVIAALFGGIGPGLAALAEGSGNAVENTFRAVFPGAP